MPSKDEETRWHGLLDRLRAGPSPRGEQFDLCRRVIEIAPRSPEAAQAARLLLEGAMADALTAIDDAQEAMRLLKALDRRQVDLAEIVAG